jgi:hypothetical protein
VLVPDGCGLLPGYVGPGAGLELVGYVLGLLIWMGAALGAILLWPLTALLRRFRKSNDPGGDEPKPEPPTISEPEGQGAGNRFTNP